ncbi:MAG TPA: hypothetical protein DD381_12165 [Lentisphaeria bacterium]|nr:MAG: hypothetical protein A2X47_09565 [Lentisphaerae bacterium GWF2_38_69]HBM17081.1 hypothetical protein [Lentisphaeria bacterium]
MTGKNALIILLSAVILSVISLFLLLNKNTFVSSYNSVIGKTLLPYFAEAEIKEIKILKPGGRSISLVKNENAQWSVGNHFNYPADTEKINAILQELASLKAIQTVNIEPEQFKALKLIHPSDNEKNTGTEIRVIGLDNKTIYSLIAGTKRIDSSGSAKITKGRYILLSNLKEPVLCEENLDETKYSAKEFLRPEFLTIKDIKKIQLNKGSNLLWTILKKDQDAEFELADKNSEDKDININNVYSIVSTLESLKFDSIADPSMKPASTGLDKPYTLNVETFGGKNYQLLIGKKFTNYYYVRIKASSFDDGEKWIYLIDKSRIIPLIQSRKELTNRKKKIQIHPEKIYSNPIS